MGYFLAGVIAQEDTSPIARHKRRLLKPQGHEKMLFPGSYDGRGFFFSCPGGYEMMKDRDSMGETFFSLLLDRQ